jgi:hypothetical protein
MTYLGAGELYRACSRQLGVINTSETDPEIVVVLVGTLDDPSSFNPTVELFWGRAQAWLRLDGQRQRWNALLGAIGSSSGDLP